MEINDIERKLDKIEKRIEDQNKELESKRRIRFILDIVFSVIFGLNLVITIAEVILGGLLL